ncbi:MAG: phosphotyrosine protein phosphatase [Litorimonas sp.]
MINILFICSRNQWRSPTGEQVWQKTPGLCVRSAGTSASARRTVNANDIVWADLIFVMEDTHKSRLRKSFPQQIKNAAIHVLDIPDEYQKNDPELIDLIRTGTESIIEAVL